jgi:SMP-30/Gluconolactonase/LRE-like region
MRRGPVRSLIIAFVLIALPVPAIGQAPALMNLVNEARAARIAGDHGRWREIGARALALTPDHPDLLISVSRANAALGRNAEALELLRQAVARGAGLDPARFAEFQRLGEDSAFRELAERARANLAPVSRATPFAMLPAVDSEGITYDPVSRRLFVGNERGELLQIDAAGAVSTFASGNGLRQVLGLKVDPRRRLLWAVTGRFPDLTGATSGPPDNGTSGIYAFDLASGRRVAAHELDERPRLHGLNDMALASDGSVYVTDSVEGAVYVLEPGAAGLRRFVGGAGMTFANGIVLSPDERSLYVAHVEGISLIDRATGGRRLLAVPPNAAVNSIDGLAWHDGALIGLQPSPYLHRIVRIALRPGGREIASVTALNARTPAEYSQTTLTVAGDSIFMVGGTPSPNIYGGPPAASPAPQVWRIPLR